MSRYKDNAPLNSLSKPVMLLALGVWLSMSLGCTSGFDMRKDIPWPELVNFDEPKKPLKMVAMWQDTVKNQTGKPAIRGFGGRVIFYGADESKPVKVDGDVDVFAFVETSHKRDDTQPDRKFVFTRDQVAKHYSESKLGHSYSFWLPWEQVGGETLHITLIARFTPAEGGGTVLSEQSRYILPGLNPPGSIYSEMQPQDYPDPGPSRYQNVTQIGYYEDAGQSMYREPPRSRAYSINVPPLGRDSEIGYRMSHANQLQAVETGSAQQATMYERPTYEQQQGAGQYQQNNYPQMGGMAPVQMQPQPQTSASSHQQRYFSPGTGGSPVRTQPPLSVNNYDANRWNRFTNAGNVVERMSAQGRPAYSPPRQPMNSGLYPDLGFQSSRWQTTYSHQDPRLPASQSPAAGYHRPATLPVQAGQVSSQGLSQPYWQPALQGQLSSPRF